jgi:hypothetical protein
MCDSESTETDRMKHPMGNWELGEKLGLISGSEAVSGGPW